MNECGKDQGRQKQTISIPEENAGICRALRNSFARAPVLPKEWQRLLDHLR